MTPLAPEHHPLVHRWVTHPKAAFWGMRTATLADVAKEYGDLGPHRSAWLGGDPLSWLVERYDPAHVELVGRYPWEPGDVGMHFLTAPSDVRVPGFTRSVITAVMTWLFEDPAVERVVVEPDVRNTAVHTLNAHAGFAVHGVVELPSKQALLSTCTRAQFHGRAA